MASSSKQLSQEELEAKKVADNLKATEQLANQAQYSITDLNGNAGMKNNFRTGDKFDVTTGNDGRLGFSTGNDPANQYRYRESDGLWYGNYGQGGGGTGGGISLGQAAPVSAPAAVAVAAPAEAAPLDWREDIDYSKSEGPEGMTTDEIVDNTGMNNWMDMGPQTAGQHINALVDPENWQYQLDPVHQQTRNIGRYINPLLEEQMAYRRKKGLLDYAKLSGGLV